MSDINRVTIVGRLTRDAEQSYTQSGYSLLKFGIAVNRRRKKGNEWVDEANFFDVVSFGRQGEAIANYMKKGRQIAVEGYLRQDRWEAQDGSKRSRVYIEASYVQLIGSRYADEALTAEHGRGDVSWQQSRTNSRDEERKVMDEEPGFEDDIPF